MRLKWIKTVRSKGKKYYYFDTGKLKDGKKVYAPLPSPDSPGFARLYATLQGHRTRQSAADTAMRVPQLIELYQRSEGYRKLASSSKRLYDIYLKRLAAQMPSAPIAAVERKHMRQVIAKMADTPGAANVFLKVTATVFKFACEQEMLKTNPCSGIQEMEVGEHEPWPDHIVEAALNAPDHRVRLLTHLLYFTAQRLGDVLAMTWGKVGDGYIEVRQEKTDTLLSIPLHQRLAAELARQPRTGLYIVPSPTGKPLSQTAARNALQHFAKGLGHKVVPHGLRKNAVITLLEVGCSVPETAAVSGQSFALVEYYARRRNQRKLADAAILTWEANRQGPGKQGKTGV